MTIRHRITLLVVLMSLAIALIGGYAVVQSSQSAKEVKAVTEGVVPSALASADLVAHLKDVQLAAMTLASAPDTDIMKQTEDLLAAKKSHLQMAIERQSGSASDKTQRGLVEQAKESMDNYFAAIDETVRLKRAGKNELAQANLFANVAQYQEELGQIVETLRVEKNREKDHGIDVLNENLDTTTATIMLVTLAAAIVLTGIGVLLYRRITGPLSRMQSMMSEIAASQDFTRRVPVDSKDEIGHSIIAFNGMIEKIQEGSGLLKQKSADIQAMLQNMQQGILTIVEGGVIHPEYSAYLEAIFETNDVEGRDFMDLVFSGAELGADIKSQVEAAGLACLGEDQINFEFNRHLLVNEITVRMPDGRKKVLDLSWSPITGDDGVILRLMLCVRDVTELRKLEAQAIEQKRRLEIIGEILAVSQEKFHDFIAGAHHFIEENERIISAHAEADSNAVAELFRNMHTIKGNARTFGLRHLTNILHETEQSYDELRRPQTMRVWDQTLLLMELSKVKEAVDGYAKINEVSLGRKGPGRKGGLEHYLMVDRKHIGASLRLLESVDPANLDELISMRDAVHQTLRLLGSDSLEEILSGVTGSLPSLAAELGKEAPVIGIDDNGYRIRSQIGPVLGNVFMHLLRNAVDHGLETAAERIGNGKPAAGRITIEAGVDNDMLQITLSDDGRGLALDRIRRMAAEKGWIDVNAPTTDEEIANLIFKPGFSTAENVTEVSGRGVGMDAVQDFIKRENGKIVLRFTDDETGAEYRRFETVLLLPDSHAVDSVAVHVASGADQLPIEAMLGKRMDLRKDGVAEA
ncbi:HAMP domain-containing protein [Herbaspirillum sp. HC18]|nr:HAMP domain-containing protein [Herbaspirillum sp. HC18]